MVIAEIAQAHDGSLGSAHAYIDIAKEGGAHAVKFQTHIADAESTPSEPWRVKFSTQDKSRYDYWKRMEFTIDQWRELKDHANDRGLIFISSPFSIEAADLLEEIGIEIWKIASGEVSNLPLFKRIVKSGLPVLLSTGMSNYEEIDKAVSLLRKGTTDITLMQCTSLYPTPFNKVGLNVLDEYRNRYGCKVGLSDHTGSIYPGLAAAAFGANAIEVHITMSKMSFGPDVPVSLTLEELIQLTEGVKAIRAILENPVDKNYIGDDIAQMKNLFNKSIVANKNLKAGSILREDDLSYKKPGTGLSPDEAENIIGKKINKDIQANGLITLSDIEQN